MQRSMAAAILVVAWVTALGCAQAVGSVGGTIRSEEGTPIANATIWTLSGQSFRDARSDDLGRFHLENVRAGERVVEVLCPSNFSLTVPVAVHRTVIVKAGHQSVMDAMIRKDACEPIPTRDVHVHWRGWYSSGFEHSSFRPCPTDSIAREVLAYGHPFGRHAWVRESSTAWQEAGLGKLATDSSSGGKYGFVEWSGMLHGPSPEGHMGMSNYRLTVDSVFAVAPKGHC